jgi:hypothetical protein
MTLARRRGAVFLAGWSADKGRDSIFMVVLYVVVSASGMESARAPSCQAGWSSQRMTAW